MYLALYRKYRPQVFDDVVSQEHITTTLKNQLKNGQTAHAYLFTGSRGTGKTTCAKILAKAVNCLHPKDGNPCLECENCKSIEEGCPDVTEIDAASNNGVDNVRALKDEAVYAPISCKYRVYIIDEVHMLSNSAFNALLKLIEEPPAHVVFIFATTEIHKVPATILSRCQRFEFRRIDINDSKKRLMQVAEAENAEVTEDAAFLISKISDGGMRDALSLLDQCLSVSREVTCDTVRECAGISGSEYLYSLAEKINQRDSAAALNILDSLVQRSKEPARLAEELIGYYRSLMLLKAGADSSIIKAAGEELQQLQTLCGTYTLEEIMRCISILSDTLSSMGRVRNPALSFEMCLIRLCTPKLDTGEKALSIRIGSLEKQLGDALARLKNGEFQTATQKPAVSQTAPEKKRESVAETAPMPELKAVPAEQEIPEPSEESYPAELPPEQFPAEPSEEIGTPEQEQPAPKEKEEPKTADSGSFVPFKEWNDIVGNMPFSVKILIEDTTASISGDTVMIEGGELAVEFASGEYRQEIQAAILAATGRRVTVVGKKPEKKTAGKNNNKVNDFLEFAKSKGVDIKVQ
ncbi:MAG: DNA polymerase III subunit gamma/tau [Ruminiclostridium sp.]